MSRAKVLDRTGIALGILSLMVAMVIGLSAWQISESRAVVRAQALDVNAKTAQLVSSALTGNVQSRMRMLTTIAEAPGLTELVAAGEWARLDEDMRVIPEIFPEYSAAAILDLRGTLRAGPRFDASVPGLDHSALPHVRRALAGAGPVVSGGFSDPAGDVSVGLAVRIVDGDRPVGVLVFTLPFSALAVVGDAAMPNAGSVTVFDREGRALTGPLAGTARAHADVPVVRAALAGEEGVGDLTLPGHPGSRLVAHTPVEELGWAVIVEQSSAAYRPVAALTGRLVTIATVAVLGAVIAALVLARSWRRLARERARATAIVAGISDGAIVADAAGRILSINDAMRGLAGQEESVVRGRSVTDAYATFDADGERVDWGRDLIGRAALEGRPVVSRPYELTMTTGTGRQLPVRITASPVRGEGPGLLGVIAIVRDVSSEREIDELKDSLVSTVSHELRTPLTMIQGFTELLLERPDMDRARARDGLRQIHDSADRLGRMIEDLLSLSSLESGRVPVELVPVDVTRLVDGETKRLAEQQGRRLTVEIPEDLPPVMADRDKLARVLVNLLSNAIKYSGPSDPVHIRARRVGPVVHVDVTDTGIGMTEVDARRAFDKFSRVDHPEVKRAGGTGLGLYITKNLVELQGGRIWVVSQPGRGSTFSFSVTAASIEGGRPHEEAAHR